MMLFFAGICSIIYAQDKKKKTEKKLKVEVPCNMSKLPGSEPDYSPKIDFGVGVEIPILNFSKMLGLHLGAAYSRQGAKLKSEGYSYTPGGGSGSSGSSTRTTRLNYLNFPILVRYQKAQYGFFAEAGVQPGLLLSAKQKSSTTTDIKDRTQKFDLGVPVGAGYQFENKIGVGVRVTPGLKNINKSDAYKNRNMVSSLRLSYTL